MPDEHEKKSESKPVVVDLNLKMEGTYESPALRRRGAAAAYDCLCDCGSKSGGGGGHGSLT